MIAALAAASFVAYAELSGSVDPGSARYLIDAIRDAEAQGAEALLIRMDTPGGLLAATRDIVQAELSAKVPVVVWVGPPGARAGSAGVFITLAAHIAAMAPSSNIGAAHPVGIGGGSGDKSSEVETMVKKIENDTAAFIHGIAERRSRNVDWAEKAVRESVSITASEALREKVVDFVAEDIPELLRKIDGQKVQIGGETRRLKTAGAELRPVEWTAQLRSGAEEWKAEERPEQQLPASKPAPSKPEERAGSSFRLPFGSRGLRPWRAARLKAARQFGLTQNY